MPPRIAVLALQGSFAEHAEALRSLGADVVLARWASDLSDVDGLIIPGGESTTIAKLTGNCTDPIFDTIIELARKNIPVYGTCMGLIFMARNIEGHNEQGRLALMDISVLRNAFGPQIASREEQAQIQILGEQPFPLVFIRGPIIVSAGKDVEVLARVKEGIVMCRQKNLLATAFHPELTNDLRVHSYFLEMVNERLKSAASSEAASQCLTDFAVSKTGAACSGKNSSLEPGYSGKVGTAVKTLSLKV